MGRKYGSKLSKTRDKLTISSFKKTTILSVLYRNFDDFEPDLHSWVQRLNQIEQVWYLFIIF